MKNLTLIVVVALLFGNISFAQQKIEYQLCDQDFSPIYMHTNLPKNAVYTDTTASPSARALDVIGRLTFDEKLMLTGGWKNMHFPSVPRLGLRPVYFSDASQGIHLKELCVRVERSTSFPCELALAATWDTELAYTYAENIGEECKAWGVSVLLGPGLNMYRNSEGGRNFEYMGEDPFLTSAMVVQYVKGLQSTGTVATLKHFIGNEQEMGRHVVNVKVDERALHEIYLPPFKAAIQEADALAIMTGNNYVNDYPGAANKPLSEDVLRKEYGFKGVIMSDWASSLFWADRQDLLLGSGHSLLMSNNDIFSEYIQNKIKDQSGEKAKIEKALNDMVFYNLYTFFKARVYDMPYRDPQLVDKMESHKKTALRTAEQAITLLKNSDHILPIDPEKVSKIVVLGTKHALTAYTGTGSGYVEGYDQIDYLTGLKSIYGNKIIHKDGITDNEIEAADAVLYFISKPSGESSDYPFDLDDSLNNDIVRCSLLNKNIAVIYSGGSGFSMPWLSEVKGLIFAWLLGQESGPALASVISGKVNPSGKLPFTIEKDFKDSPAYDYNKMSDGNYYWGGGKGFSKQYREKFGNIDISYDEGVFMGYRWYEKKNIQPQFPFGYGLSYTDFKISGIKSSSKKIGKDKSIMISISIENSGKVSGAEVVQLYIGKKDADVDRPVKELKGFKKVELGPGEIRTVNIPVTFNDFAFWSTKEHGWKVMPGEYLIEIGNSSQGMKQSLKIQL